MSQKRTCITCDEEYALTHDRKGLTTQCDDCGGKSEVPRVQGRAVVEGKNWTYVQRVDPKTGRRTAPPVPRRQRKVALTVDRSDPRPPCYRRFGQDFRHPVAAVGGRKKEGNATKA